MKKLFKSRIFCFILGALIFSSVTAYAGYKYLASEVSFTPSDESWQVEDVETALNELYQKSEEDVLYLPTISAPLQATSGGGSYTRIDNKNYNKLTINSRIRGGVVGTTYWRIAGIYDDGSWEYLLNTTSPSTIAQTFDISKYSSIEFRFECTAVGSNYGWYDYYFNGITFSK